ncbi:MAG TPA: metalloregulator ArsR/SmtB family transcription factor [Patescibacteria group bacterium]|nr:metalloregulator ArsR/SmtB family transcription factor [Patescibacteria group bacterium]
MEQNLQTYTETAEWLKALAHPVRLCIVRGLLEKGGCNVSHMQECLGVPQSTISQHLQKLRLAGIISGERSGLEIRYQVSEPKVRALIGVLFEEIVKMTEG